jgi:PmbA protein
MRALLGRDTALERAREAVAAARAAGADQAEAVIQTEDSGLTRYAGGRVHQHVTGCDAEVQVRSVVGRRVAVARGNQTSPDALAALAERATAMARHSAEEPDFAGLPEPTGGLYVDQTTWYEATADVGPAERVAVVADILDVLGDGDATGYGVVTNGATELAVANSLGVHAYQAFTDGWLSVIAERAAAAARGPHAFDDTSARKPTGYASAGARDWTTLDAHTAALTALTKASTPGVTSVAPGRYTVILEEEAVAELLLYLAMTAFNGLDYLEGRSLYSRRLGEKPYPDRITLRDDPTDARGANVSFDFEGVPKAPATLIRAGALEQVAWDTATARRAGQVNTSHALPAPNPFGPVPTNLVLAPGTTRRRDLLAQVDRGLLVTRFHYVNIVDESKTILTGMTRDGTFLIERGEVVGAVQDLRWVESIDAVLRQTVDVGAALKLVSSGPGYGLRFFDGSLVPSLLVDGFTITGSAEQP